MNIDHENQSEQKLAELHAHLGTSVNPAIYWQIAQDLGIVLPKRDYHEFVEYIMISPEKPMPLAEYFDKIYHSLLDKLSSGTHAVEKATYEIFSGAYRSNHITLLELRSNPMKHNNNSEVDLDQLTMAMLRGMERALMAYPKLSGGLIFCLGKEFSYEMNEIIVQKAIKYKNRGVVGIDVAGLDNPNFIMADYEELFDLARKAGLKITIHAGEHKTDNDMWEALNFAKPDRIGHGIYAAYDDKLMDELIKQDVVLEICPFSNLATKAVESVEEMRFILQTFIRKGVKFTINTDWPEVIKRNHLHEQFSWLIESDIMTQEELNNCNKLAFNSSFIKGPGMSPYLN